MNKIILGVTGSIAAYKALSLVRLLIKKGKEVRVIMTPSATEFVAPLSFSTLSKNDVYVDVVDEHSWNNHVALGLWADAFVVAPATASTLSKMASGQSDNMLVATYLSAKCPIFIAPAMDLDMWKHPATKQNIEQLESYGNHLIPVGVGELASGLVGPGRMAEPEEIVYFLEEHSKKKVALKGRKVVITAGPTQESIDPVRFISNHSTGRMGIALAEACYQRGAEVTLILGPTDLRPRSSEINLIHITSAEDMYDACKHLWTEIDIAIFAAAVADYTPKNSSKIKVKKKEGDLSINLKRTVDIAETFGRQKANGQVSVGFALETNNEEENARRKLNKKNFDLIVLNSLREEGAGFGHTTNKVSIIQKNNAARSFEVKPKSAVARDIVDMIIPFFN